MKTPISDFVNSYSKNSGVRLHMPGHKGKSFLGCEHLDITEIKGADNLYAPVGIIAQSEENACQLFDSGLTLFSTEGSSQCIRAMLHLALQKSKQKGERQVVLAGRNVHKTFVYAAALLDFDVEWLMPQQEIGSICSCVITANAVEEKLKQMEIAPSALYITSPDYLGNILDIEKIAKVCKKAAVPLLVDNAHGAYLHFLQNSIHPMDLGADFCCDSAHKTLPVLTGGAYLHISRQQKVNYLQAKQAMEMFGSTSPSYLILQSLDLCNAYLDGQYRNKLNACIEKINTLKICLAAKSWNVMTTEPLKLTLNVSSCTSDGIAIAENLHNIGIECEYADRDYIVFMFTTENSEEDYEKLKAALGCCEFKKADHSKSFFLQKPVTKCSIREAVFAKQEQVMIEQAIGRVSASPTVSCPPAIPIAVSGELITQNLIDVFKYYNIDTISVVVE